MEIAWAQVVRDVVERHSSTVYISKLHRPTCVLAKGPPEHRVVVHT